MVDALYATNRMSSWDNHGYSKSFDKSRSLQNVSSIPMAVPYSTYNSQNTSQYSVDGRSIQQSKYQAVPTNNNNNISDKGWCAKHISVTRVIGVLIGLIVTGVPLAVIVTMYIQLLTSSDNTATSGSSSTVSTSISLPYQCSNYASLTDFFRPVTYTATYCICDSISATWYRVSGAAGTQIATSPVTTGSCGTSYPAWYNGSLPTTIGTTTSGVACVNVNSNLCYLGYSNGIVLATNCNGFYVFYLPPLICPCCCPDYPHYCTV